MKNKIIDNAQNFITNTYTRYPVVFQTGSGVNLFDTDGKKYKDFLAGIAVCNLGHAHPGIAKIISKQAEKLIHVSNLFYTIPQVELASLLVEKSFADKVFFGNSGAEANEAAIKLARKYFSSKGESEKYRIITMKQSFHGRTMATLTATGQDKIKEGFSPVLPGFDYVPFNDINALQKMIGAKTCAVMVEPIQGEGGICIPDSDYLEKIRTVCDDNKILLIYDEIQTGMGRTGKLFAYENYGVAPDIMTLAKALGNGLPIGAMLAKEEVAKAFGPGTHASTFGGTPLVTAAATEVCKIISDKNFLKHVREMGTYFKDRLLTLQEKYLIVEQVRGVGLMVGLKLSIEGSQIVDQCLSKGFVINCIQGNILRFAPPLIIEKNDIDALVQCLYDIFAQF